MKLTELFQKDGLMLSFEVFPPKTDSAFDSVKTATEEIAKLRPSFMSVTYGAGGGTSKYTLEIAKNIKAEYGVPTLAHLTCVSSTRETVKERIGDMKAAGIQNVMALRGDLTPELMDSDLSSCGGSHPGTQGQRCGFLHRRCLLSRGASRKPQSGRGYFASEGKGGGRLRVPDHADVL